ncbi:MAG TPA: transposase, partial [Microbacteriaceae bacterium]
MIKPVDLAQVAAQLYALAPDRFTAARNEQAAAASRGGDKQLGAHIRRLAKPPVAAWVVNLLVRRSAEEIDQVLELGTLLREATEGLDRGDLKELGRQRQKLVSVIARRGAELSEELGQPVSVAALREVEQTLHAAMADEHAAAAVRTGCLVRSLSATGFEPVELAGAVAVEGVVPATTPAARPSKPERGDRDRARRSAEEAAQAEEVAVHARAEADNLRSRLTELDTQHDRLDHELRGVLEQATRLESALRAAGSDARFVRQALERAERDAEAAGRAA